VKSADDGGRTLRRAVIAFAIVEAVIIAIVLLAKLGLLFP
jgi:hypothetical protein